MIRYRLIARPLVTNDRAEPESFDQLQALVSSGDCFVTLATQLDSIDHITLHAADREALQSTIHALLDLQRRYRIIAKPPDYRQ